MTIEEYNELEEDDIVHFKGDTESVEDYNWTVMHKMSEGIMIENENNDPIYLDKDEVLEKLDISKYTKIDSWRVLCDKNHRHAWDGEVDVTLDRVDLAFILKGIMMAFEKNIITKEYMESLLDKLNVRYVQGRSSQN